jgi:NAD-dependent deacetylase
MSEEAEKLRSFIAQSGKIVFFGGAGVSTASGIPDFRGTYGLFQKERGISYEEMLSHEHFTRKPEDFFDFYTHGMLYPEAKPNGAHKALAELERRGKLTCVVTQNIDGLHTLAGNTNVIELHGSALRNTCMKCGRKYGMEKILAADGGIPYCSCGGIVKPDVVLYGERLDEEGMRRAAQYISDCDLLIVAGTSLVVYPAAGFVRYARGKTVLLNRDATAYDSCADLVIHGDLSEILEEAVFR